ncbi:MAG TPA: hypothetical protein VFM07_11545, partial [Intrasporangium sp.]|nr:hypothetical protein [Intrasporangium sp.]
HPAAGVELTDVGGVQAVPVARAVVRTALTMGTAAAVVAGDAALHSGLVTPNELLAEVALLSAHEGRQRALDALHRMDTAAESVAEVVWLEKRREDRIRRLGHPVERLVWEELAAPGLVGERIRAKRPNTPGYRQRTGFGSG